MTTCAVIDSNNQVVNLIVAEPTDIPPEGCTLVLVPFCDIGYTWDGTNFNPPVATPPSVPETTTPTDPNPTVDS
jgi:hypothetical protein